jgi:hypothetical protein
VTAPLLGFALILTVLGCATTTPIKSVAELAGQWQGSVSSPAGHAAAALTIAPDGAFKGTMFLIGLERGFHGALTVVRSGEVRYQGTDGNGTVRVLDQDGHRVLKFFRDGGGVDAVFRPL